MSARPNLRLVDSHGELQGEACLGCVELSKKIATMAGELTKLRNEEAERQATSANAKQVREVLLFWRPLCMPRARIVAGSERWRKTADRLKDVDVTTGRLAYTPLHLKAAVVGAKLSENHVENGWLDAKTIFRDSTTVDSHIARCTTFKRETGVSALELVDELAGPHLAKLAARCTCGHHRLDHERENPAEELWDPPCAVHGCCCEGFDDFDWRVERWKQDRERIGA